MSIFHLFWYDHWSKLGRLIDITGHRGVIDLGISLDETVESVLRSQRRRRHRIESLNNIEQEIFQLSQRHIVEGNDVSLWKATATSFKNRFMTKATWKLTRNSAPRVEWSTGVWFSYATPKYSFLTWLAVHNRLATGDRIKQWNSGQRVECTLCNTNVEETRNHLFFSCTYSSTIWKALTQRLLSPDYSTEWDTLLTLLHDSGLPKIHLFLIRYTFQATLYHLWHERNARRHGVICSTKDRLLQLIDKTVRNRLSSIREMGDRGYEHGLQLWFATRPNS